MILDNLIPIGKREALMRFRLRADENCESLDFNRTMEEAHTVFDDTVVEKGRELGFIETDIYFFTFRAWDTIKAEFTKECRHELVVIQKEHAVNQVRSVQVEYIIEPKIKAMVLPYCIVYQKYRIKVCVLVAFKRYLEFYIRYRDFNDERIIDGIPEMIRSNVRYIQDYGPQLSLRGSPAAMDWKYPENYKLEL